MTISPQPLDTFLSEFTASLKQSGGDAVLRRINAERLLRFIAEELIESHQAERIRVLADNRLAGESGADFLLQIDDYDIRLEFLDAPNGKPELRTDQLPALMNLLEDNPSTVALVLVWTTDDLQALAMSLSEIQKARGARQLAAMLKETQPLRGALREIVSQQTKRWDIRIEQKPQSSAEPADIRRLFESAIGQAIEAERDRSYKLTERKTAAKHFPIEEEKRVIFQALKEALGGANAQDLVPLLIHLPRRGAK
jgi:hypothetical protein